MVLCLGHVPSRYRILFPNSDKMKFSEKGEGGGGRCIREEEEEGGRRIREENNHVTRVDWTLAVHCPYAVS